VPWAEVERVLVVVWTEEQMRKAVTEVTAAAEAAGLRKLPVMVITTITPEQARWLSGIESMPSG
jgi:hypothetical protein